MKNYFFATSVVLALVFSGCDGSGEAVVASDAGSPAVVPAGSPYCKVPTQEYLPPGAATVPVHGYLWLANPAGQGFVCAPYVAGGVGPSKCSNPDGFSDGRSTWCCVITTPSSDPKYVYAVLPSLSCVESDGKNPIAKSVAADGTLGDGDVALCTTSGVFAGWKCPSSM